MSWTPPEDAELEEFARNVGRALSTHKADPHRFVEHLTRWVEGLLLDRLAAMKVTQHQERLRAHTLTELARIHEVVRTFTTATYTDPLTREPGTSMWVEE